MSNPSHPTDRRPSPADGIDAPVSTSADLDDVTATGAVDVDVGDAAADPTSDTVIATGPSIVNAGPGARASGPPPRPDMSLSTPAPILKTVPMTKTVQFSRITWFLSFGLGLAAVLFAFFSNGARQTLLESLVSGVATEQDTASAANVAALLFWSGIVVLLAVTVLEAVLVFAMLRGRAGVRWALLPIVFIVHTIAGLIADAFVAIDDSGRIITILIIAQWFAAVIATIASFLAGTQDWFAAKRELRMHPGEIPVK